MAIKTFSPISELTEVQPDKEAVWGQLMQLLQLLDSDQRKRLLAQEFKVELDTIIQHETQAAVDSITEQSRLQLLQNMEELEYDYKQKQNAVLEQWHKLIQSLTVNSLPVNIVQEDDLIAILVEATYRVLTEHLSPEDHLRRIVRQTAENFAKDRPLRLLLSESDFNLTTELVTPENIELAHSPELDAGSYQLELGNAKVVFSLTDQLSQLSLALLSARKAADA